jgi:hypothetical protein
VVGFGGFGGISFSRLDVRSLLSTAGTGGICCVFFGWKFWGPVLSLERGSSGPTRLSC